MSSPSSKAARASSTEKIVVPAANSSYSSGCHLGHVGHDLDRLLRVVLDVVEREVPGVDQGLHVLGPLLDQVGRHDDVVGDRAREVGAVEERRGCPPARAPAG